MHVELLEIWNILQEAWNLSKLVSIKFDESQGRKVNIASCKVVVIKELSEFVLFKLEGLKVSHGSQHLNWEPSKATSAESQRLEVHH